VDIYVTVNIYAAINDNSISYDESAGFNDLPTRHITGHCGDKSFEAINSTGNENKNSQKQQNKTQETYRTCSNTCKLALVKNVRNFGPRKHK